MSYPDFEQDIARMNAVYKLPTITTWIEMFNRIRKFEDILKEECNEIQDITAKLAEATDDNSHVVMLDARVMLADLLGDIIVYCASEAQCWDIEIGEVLAIIMASNFSKLGADGKPIKDARGKFLKGPNYWKPEPYIKAYLEGFDLLYKADGTIQVEDPNNKLAVPINMDAVVAAATQQQNQPKET